MSLHPWPIPQMARTLQVVGDTHFKVLNQSPNDTKRSAKILADIEAMRPPLQYVQIGDGVDKPAESGAFTELVAFLKALEALAPTNSVAGNHDLWANEATIAHWAEELGIKLVPTAPEGLARGNYYIDYPLFRLIFMSPETMLNVAAPASLAAEAVGSGGTFAAGEYWWQITATSEVGETIGSNIVKATIATNGSAKLTWTSPAGAKGIKVYRATTEGGLKSGSALVATLGVVGGGEEAVKSYTDTGAAASSGTVPVSNTALDRITIWLPSAVTTWLSATLKATTKPCIILCHAPLKGTHPGGGTTNGSSEVGFGVQPDATIKAILAENANAKAWISGHTHAAIDHTNQAMQYEVGGRKIAAINASSPAYTGTGFGPSSRLCSIFVTPWFDAAEPHIEVRARDHGAGIWTPLDAPTSLIKTVAVG